MNVLYVFNLLYIHIKKGTPQIQEAMSDAWNAIQAIKSKRNSLREKLEKRKKERQDILGTAALLLPSSGSSSSTQSHLLHSAAGHSTNPAYMKCETVDEKKPNLNDSFDSSPDPEVEHLLLQILSDQALTLPITSKQLLQRMNSLRFRPVSQEALNYFLEKLAAQSYIR